MQLHLFKVYEQLLGKWATSAGGILIRRVRAWGTFGDRYAVVVEIAF